MNKDIAALIINGEIGVLPTDTIYGIHGQALKKEVVDKIYKIRDRNPQKPFIILISSIDDLRLFNIRLDKKTLHFLEKIWPGKISVILPCPFPQFSYLHRGTNGLAFRMPKKIRLLTLLKQTGPLISTSVNPEGLEPAKTIGEAKKYFGNNLSFYVDQGHLKSSPSTLIKIEGEKIKVLRQGGVKIPSKVL